jgi:ABC-type sugar transport system permease subunit
MSARSAVRRSRRPYLRRPDLWFLLPAVVWGLTFTLYPIVHTLTLSFQRARLGRPASWVGLDNFSRLLSDPQFWSSLRFTVVFVVVTVTVQIVLGLALAILLNRPLPLPRPGAGDPAAAALRDARRHRLSRHRHVPGDRRPDQQHADAPR